MDIITTLGNRTMKDIKPQDGYCTAKDSVEDEFYFLFDCSSCRPTTTRLGYFNYGNGIISDFIQSL